MTGRGSAVTYRFSSVARKTRETWHNFGEGLPTPMGGALDDVKFAIEIERLAGK